MRGRLEARLERLEEVAGQGPGTPSAVVRFNPDGQSNWLPAMFAKLGWCQSLVALVTIDASGPAGVDPEVVVAPVDEKDLTIRQQEVLAYAGRGPGQWWIAIAGRGWSEAVAMTDGEEALLADLRAQRRREQWGHDGGI